MRKSLIVANWKCNPTSLKKAESLFNSIKKGIKGFRGVEVVICPPFLYLPILIKPSSAHQKVVFGGQSCFWEGKGAFTGEVSPTMLKNLGCKYVIIGHSERRKYFYETETVINKKLKSALKNNLKPILCIDKIPQIKKALKGITKKEVRKITFAYEPIWAIGTGKTPTFDQAGKVNLSIKKLLGRKTVVLYGGSVNSKNAKGFISKSGFDGLLVGGASLKPREFVGIVKSVAEL